MTYGNRQQPGTNRGNRKEINDLQETGNLSALLIIGFSIFVINNDKSSTLF